VGKSISDDKLVGGSNGDDDDDDDGLTSPLELFIATGCWSGERDIGDVLSLALPPRGQPDVWNR
jgi:hypothetical protein